MCSICLTRPIETKEGPNARWQSSGVILTRFSEYLSKIQVFFLTIQPGELVASLVAWTRAPSQRGEAAVRLRRGWNPPYRINSYPASRQPDLCRILSPFQCSDSVAFSFRGYSSSSTRSLVVSAPPTRHPASPDGLLVVSNPTQLICKIDVLFLAV